MRLSPWVRYAVSAAAAGLLCWRVPRGGLWAAFQSLESQQLLPALACVLAMLAVRAYKWNQLLSESGPTVQPRDAIRSLLGGFALGVVVPGRLGELGRCLFLPGPDRARVALLNILDRALDMWAVMSYGVGSLFLIAPRPAAIFALGVWLAALPLVMGFPTLISTLSALPRWPERLRAPLAGAAPTLRSIRTPRFAALSLASTSLDLLLLFFLLRAFHPVDFTVALAAFPWIVMGAGLPVSVSGFGFREGIAALLLARYAIPAAVAVDVALLLFVFSALVPAAIGGLWLLADRGRSKRARLRDAGSLLGGAWQSPGVPATSSETRYCREPS